VAKNEALDALIAAHSSCEGPLLPILNAVQATFGYVDEAAIRTIASAQNLSRAEVHGVVSFYHDYRSAPAALPIIRLCRAEACQARGADALAVTIAPLVAGRVSIEPVYCLGLCSVGPNAMIGHTPHARLDVAALTALVEGL
jgi:formate dehydrogenase subunit gamma